MLHGRKGFHRPHRAALAQPASGKSDDIAEHFVDEKLEFDADRLVELVVAHGEAGAQARVDDSLREIATLTAELVHFFAQYSFSPDGDVATLCRKIENSANSVGLQQYLKILGDFRASYQRGDPNAQSAVLHRLARLTASAVRESWDIHRHLE